MTDVPRRRSSLSEIPYAWHRIDGDSFRAGRRPHRSRRRHASGQALRGRRETARRLYPARGGSQEPARPVDRPGGRPDHRLGARLQLRRSEGEDAGHVRHRLPRRLRVQAVHRPGRDAARGARRPRPRRPDHARPARLQADQHVRQGDHSTSTDVPSGRPGARAADRQLLRPRRAVAGTHREKPQRDRVGLRPRKPSQIQQRRPRRGRLRAGTDPGTGVPALRLPHDSRPAGHEAQ